MCRMSASGTQNVYVRGMPRDLWRRLRAAAAIRGCSLRDLVVEALTAWLIGEDA